MVQEDLNRELTRIANKCFVGLVRSDLEAKHSDSDDFFDAAVWELKEALIAAYALGRRDKVKGEG